jgi:hypothetical protein
MPRYNVTYHDKWACFSSVVDGFVTKFMGKQDYEAWRIREYGSNCRPIEECNIITMNEAVSSIRIYNSHGEAIDQLVGCGISQEESEKLIFDIETEYYVPILKNGKYECPNCGSEVDRGSVM